MPPRVAILWPSIAAGAVGLAAFLRRARRVDAELRSECTTPEWSFAMKQRWCDVLVGLAFNLHNQGWTAGYVKLAGSPEAMAVHYGICSTFMAVLNFIGEPLVAALSDRFGRRPFLVWGRLGLCAWFLTYTRVDLYGKLWMRLAGEAICFGVIGVGHWSVFAASQSDIFGTRPNLSSRLDTADAMWTRMVSVAGGIAGVYLTNRLGALHVGHIAFVLGAFTITQQHSCSSDGVLDDGRLSKGGRRNRCNHFRHHQHDTRDAQARGPQVVPPHAFQPNR
jgi:hypothetical protein